jgi:hypothetical protein
MTLSLLLLIMGGCFVVIGIALYIWGHFEENHYYNAIVHRFDVREYLEHMPFRPEPGALRIGGTVAIIVGVLLLAAGGALWLLNITSLT